MKTVLLTTQTLHHVYFLKKLAKVYPVGLVLTETTSILPPFETHHSFEDERDEYECKEWFNGNTPPLSDYAETKKLSSINDDRAVSLLKEIRPDVVVVFGTGKLSGEVIATCPTGMINLHGGDPEKYRGLDSHLWAIYHKDFDSLIVTLHKVNDKLDDGEIILQASIELFPNMPLFALRRYNTELCIKITVSSLDMFARFGKFISKKQCNAGRYYSFMPNNLKEICKNNFERHTNEL